MRGAGVGRFLRAAMVVALATLPSCDSRDRLFPSGSPLALVLHLENEQGDRVTHFALGERIRLVLEITNPTPESVQLRFRTRKVFDFAVWGEDGGIVWKWSRNRLFGYTFTVLEFEPGATETAAVEWDQHPDDPAREPLRPGMFRARAFLPAETGDVVSRDVSFRID